MTETLSLRFLLWSHLAVTWALVGLIWTIQVLQYPLFARVGEAAFVGYHAAHSSRITLVVLPLMLVELVTAGLLILLAPASVPMSVRWLGFGAVVVIWLSTFLLQVPRHGILSQGFDPEAHRFLVASNWLRTVVWTFRGFLAVFMVDRWLGDAHRAV